MMKRPSVTMDSRSGFMFVSSPQVCEGLLEGPTLACLARCWAGPKSSPDGGAGSNPVSLYLWRCELDSQGCSSHELTALTSPSKRGALHSATETRGASNVVERACQILDVIGVGDLGNKSGTRSGRDRPDWARRLGGACTNMIGNDRRIRRRLSPALWCGWLVVVALLLAGCTTTYPEQLAALKQDPMAQLSLPGAKLERRFEQDATSGGLMNMSQRANVTEVFSIANVASVDGVNAAATRAAENAGWTVEFRSELTGATQWAKTLASRKATLGITPKREGLEARLTIVLTIP
jgi:hypothetical protein